VLLTRHGAFWSWRWMWVHWIRCHEQPIVGGTLPRVPDFGRISFHHKICHINNAVWFIYSLLCGACRSSGHIMSNSWIVRIMSWKGCGRKRSCSKLTVPSRHFPEVTEEKHETPSVRIVDVLTDIRTWHLPCATQICCHLALFGRDFLFSCA
jgi:hypothetical protein